MIKLNKIAADFPCPVYAKVEYFNPGHSVKDRMALKMVEDAEARGDLKPGGTIIECTSGNTGMGLALAAIVKGYKLICTLSDKQSKEKMDILRAMERDLGRRLGELKVDGGAAANNLLLQLQADYLGRSIVRPKVIETTVAGACFLAGLGMGIWRNTDALAKVWRADQTFPSRMGTSPRRKRLASWQQAINRAKAAD